MKRMTMKRVRKIKVRPQVNSHLNDDITATSIINANTHKILNHKMAESKVTDPSLGIREFIYSQD